MAVIVHEDRLVAGSTVKVPKLYPSGILFDNAARTRAHRLDRELATRVGGINREFAKLDADTKSEASKRWAWLGGHIDCLVRELERSDHLQREDIETNVIWLAIRQYLTEELKIGNNKDRGTQRDYLRRCWMFSKGPHQWLPNWSSWLRLTHRGSQLTTNEEVLRAMEKALSPHKDSLGGKDYEIISKKLAESLPSVASKKASVSFMGRQEIQVIIDDIARQVLQSKRPGGDKNTH